METSVINRVSQLIPAGTYATFQMIASTIIGAPAAGGQCATDQIVLLWITLVGVVIACFISSYVGDVGVGYAIKSKWLTRLLPPSLVHAMFAVSALLVITLVNQTTFGCLFGVELDDTVIRAVPIIYSSVVVIVYSTLFVITPTSVTQSSPSKSPQPTIGGTNETQV